MLGLQFVLSLNSFFVGVYSTGVHTGRVGIKTNTACWQYKRGATKAELE
jgi:hypothetical protein